MYLEELPNKERFKKFYGVIASNLNESLFDFIARARGPGQYGNQTYVLEHTDYKPFGNYNSLKDVENITELGEIPTIWIDESKKANPHQDGSVYITQNSNLGDEQKDNCILEKVVCPKFLEFYSDKENEIRKEALRYILESTRLVVGKKRRK